MALLTLSGWTLFGVFFACQSIASSAYFGRPPAVRQNFLIWLTCAYLWALLTPLVLALAKKFPLEKKVFRQRLSIHLAACILLSFLQLAAYILIRAALMLLMPIPPPPDSAAVVAAASEPVIVATAWQAYKGLLVSAFHENVLLYFSLVGLWHAADYYRRFRERERRAAQLELEAAQLETQLARAQLDALKMQIHPHFLFNTLNTISVLMQEEDTETANRMLVRLSDLLRLALKTNGTHEVALRQELEFLRSYLEIEQTRFQDRLKVNIKADPETLDARVPNLILQPLVENCIRHSVAPRVVQSKIEIRAERRNGNLQLTVRDDGDGIDEAVLKSTKGIGIANTRARLEKLYGAAHHDFQLVSDNGLTVKISIPFRHFKIPDDNKIINA